MQTLDVTRTVNRSIAGLPETVANARREAKVTICCASGTRNTETGRAGTPLLILELVKRQLHLAKQLN